MTKSWEKLRAERMDHRDGVAGYETARAAFEFGRRVRERRESLGLTQAELAKALGTSQSAIARLEAGGSEPSLRTMTRLAKALQADWIVGTESVTSQVHAPAT